MQVPIAVSSTSPVSNGAASTKPGAISGADCVAGAEPTMAPD